MAANYVKIMKNFFDMEGSFIYGKRLCFFSMIEYTVNHKNTPVRNEPGC